MTDPDVIAIDHVKFVHGPWIWAFAVEQRDEIAAHFEAWRAKAPKLWNGRVLLVKEYSLEGATLRGTFFETDFASFIAWRDWKFPDQSVKNCFAMGAIRSADGAYILGVMSQHTANPGHVYFPSGTPDQDDIVGNTVDLAGSVLREVAEETGLAASDFDIQPGWTAVFAGASIALMQTLQARDTAESLRAKILLHLSQEADPELSDIHIVRHRGDFDSNMPEFMAAFLAQALAD
jgi:8-oxo-dGTP pyrophosphatase MutT (NUDIX family)